MMKTMRTLSILGAAIACCAAAYAWAVYGKNVNIPQGSAAASAGQEVLPYLRTAEGYDISIFAALDAPLRQLAIGDDGWVFAGSRGAEVFALRDSDQDGAADDKRIVAKGLQHAHGVAFSQGDLYIGDVRTIYLLANVTQQLRDGRALHLRPVITGLPKSRHHGMRHLRISPQGDALYIALGVPCNICQPPSQEYHGVIRRYALPIRGEDEGAVYARGIRNSVGMDFHPLTGELWFTDNGRDWLGDDLPNDELNRVRHVGEHFGYPFCHQGDLPDPQYGDADSCARYTPPVLLTGPHVANLGMAFGAGGKDLFIALHGSWNRSEKIGYGVHRAVLRGNQVVQYQPFVSGWLGKDATVRGRPVDLAVLPEGVLLISDDYAGVIYRLAPRDLPTN